MAGKYTKRTTPEEVQSRLEAGEKLILIDVREDEEWESGHIASAKHIPLGTLGERHVELDKDKEMIVICRSGNRSGLACEFLEASGYKVVNMEGGMLEWDGEVSRD